VRVKTCEDALDHLEKGEGFGLGSRLLILVVLLRGPLDSEESVLYYSSQIQR
jgi:hypothetical protein